MLRKSRETETSHYLAWNQRPRIQTNPNSAHLQSSKSLLVAVCGPAMRAVEVWRPSHERVTLPSAELRRALARQGQLVRCQSPQSLRHHPHRPAAEAQRSTARETCEGTEPGNPQIESTTPLRLQSVRRSATSHAHPYHAALTPATSEARAAQSTAKSLAIRTRKAQCHSDLQSGGAFKGALVVPWWCLGGASCVGWWCK
jgi:hypothetical protein